METPLNILILSCGSRNKILQYFKKELKGKGQVFATDCNSLAPALYEADNYFIVPEVSDEKYVDTIVTICRDYNIKGIFTLIDTEISILAENKKRFEEVGTIPIVSGFDIVKACLDKYQFHQLLSDKGFSTIQSYIDKDLFYKDLKSQKIKFPVFVKPVKGSASININKVESSEELNHLFHKFDNLLIQEYMNGVEYGVDAYIDILSGKLVNVFIKEKIKMRAGETDKSVSVKETKLFNLVKEFVESVKFKGTIDIDIFKVNGRYFISEVNPRFGGGYPHAHECGVNFSGMIIQNLEGKVNQSSIGSYDEDIYMMKYNELKIIKGNY